MCLGVWIEKLATSGASCLPTEDGPVKEWRESSEGEKKYSGVSVREEEDEEAVLSPTESTSDRNFTWNP